MNTCAGPRIQDPMMVEPRSPRPSHAPCATTTTSIITHHRHDLNSDPKSQNSLSLSAAFSRLPTLAEATDFLKVCTEHVHSYCHTHTALSSVHISLQVTPSILSTTVQGCLPEENHPRTDGQRHAGTAGLSRSPISRVYDRQQCGR